MALPSGSQDVYCNFPSPCIHFISLLWPAGQNIWTPGHYIVGGYSREGVWNGLSWLLLGTGLDWTGMEPVVMEDEVRME